MGCSIATKSERNRVPESDSGISLRPVFLAVCFTLPRRAQGTSTSVPRRPPPIEHCEPDESAGDPLSKRRHAQKVAERLRPRFFLDHARRYTGRLEHQAFLKSNFADLVTGSGKLARD